MTHVSSSVGIIGGADGPTAVFVTGNPLPFLLTAGLVLALVIGGAVALWLHHKNKED